MVNNPYFDNTLVFVVVVVVFYRGVLGAAPLAIKLINGGTRNYYIYSNSVSIRKVIISTH